MSYGQLFPQGTVPSAGIASATFSDYGPGFDFTTPDRPTRSAAPRAAAPRWPRRRASSARRRSTRASRTAGTSCPATTEYYGGDFPVFTVD